SRLVTLQQPIRGAAAGEPLEPPQLPEPSEPLDSSGSLRLPQSPASPEPREPAAPGSPRPRARVGEIRPRPGSIPLNDDKPRRRLRVHNDSPYPVWVSSHFPLERANPRLQFDRESAKGWRLDLPAGDVMLFPPGSVTEVDLVPRGPSEGGDR